MTGIGYLYYWYKEHGLKIFMILFCILTSWIDWVIFSRASCGHHYNVLLTGKNWKKKIKHSKICAVDSIQSSIEVLVNQQKGFRITNHSLKCTQLPGPIYYEYSIKMLIQSHPYLDFLTFHSHLSVDVSYVMPWSTQLRYHSGVQAYNRAHIGHLRWPCWPARPPRYTLM